MCTSDKTILEWDEFGKQVPWGVLLLVRVNCGCGTLQSIYVILMQLGAGFSLAEAFEVSGLSQWIGVRLQFFGGFPVCSALFQLPALMHRQIVVIVASVCTIITFLTELTRYISLDEFC